MADDVNESRTPRKVARPPAQAAAETRTPAGASGDTEMPPGAYVAAEPLYVGGVLAHAVGDHVHPDNINRHGWAGRVRRIDTDG